MKFIVCAGLATLALSSFAFATEARNLSVTAIGSGCPDAGKSVPYGFDGQWLTIELHQAYPVKVVKGAGISLEDGRKNCAFTLDLDAPGYRYAVERVVTWGAYQLGNNDQFTATLNGSFQGDGDTFTSNASATGPVWNQQNYNFDRTLSGSNLVWSECSSDRALTLNTAVRVSPKGNGNHDTWSTGSLDRVAFRFIYRKC